MEGEKQHGNLSGGDQVNNLTSVLSSEGPQNSMQGVSEEPPKETQFFGIAPSAEKPLDMDLGLSLGGMYKEIKESPNPNPLSLTPTRAATANNADPPITSAWIDNGIPPQRPPLQQQRPPLPLYYTTGHKNLIETAPFVEAQKKSRFEAYRRLLQRRRARQNAETEAAAAAAASLPAPPLATASAAAAQPPQVPLQKLIMLPAVVASDVENRELCRTVQKMNALGESSAKKVLEGASTLAAGVGVGSSSSHKPWTSHQPNSDMKAASAAKAVYGKSAIVIEDISDDEQVKRPRLANAVRNSNAPQKNRNDDGVRGMKQLLTVTTIGDGPEGKKVDGFLHKNGKGGQIFIVCLCHGVFLSPAEFVKHANHTDWSNPMKHIAVSSPPSPPPPF